MAFKLTSAALLAAIVTVGAAAPLAAAPSMTKIDIAAFDPDKDGTIDAKEVETAAAAAFAKLEKDKDGTLDVKELEGRLTAADLKKADPDGDGTLDQKEYVALALGLFKAADPDNDGTIDAKELMSPAGSALVQVIR
ncbi:EF-hand domain-containing protein [Methylobacterium brachythecii]|uniref:Ca2+-binding EF-hand superfamily protein n=1 Tax=Methylobacterium brachythecii TaxID=1176177 RepID=A0A7W6F6S9_9HYPH|nr:EF-hand domain-containing protein [Methylobacterium brachythecii]MBB3902628.1 Ca2+-binding EF-hand superfamily protein [Methylobacterium brachythecii]GLS42472.1 calcium-binding protein [Methylobacterium brachythecii]